LSTASPSNAQIYYTLDGSIPTSSSTLYTAPVVLNANATITAIAYADGYDPSGLLVITPGDRVDILLAAATSATEPDQQLAGVVLTGEFTPQAAIARIIEKLPFPILRADQGVYEVASTVHNLIVKPRADDTEKISVIRDIIATHVDVSKILAAL